MTSTVFFKNKPSVIATSTVGGPKEGEGQLGRFIEKISEDDTFGEKTYEKAECKMISFVIDNVIKNAKMKESDINAIISGDLLNQIISSSFSARKFDIPYLGIYNACSTMTEAFALGGVLCDGIIALNKIEFFEKFRVQLSEVRVHKCIISGVIRVCRTEYSADRVHDFLKVYN